MIYIQSTEAKDYLNNDPNKWYNLKKKKTPDSQPNNEKSNWPGYLLNNIWIINMLSNTWNFKQLNIYQHVCIVMQQIHCTIDPTFREFITKMIFRFKLNSSIYTRNKG